MPVPLALCMAQLLASAAVTAAAALHPFHTGERRPFVADCASAVLVALLAATLAAAPFYDRRLNTVLRVREATSVMFLRFFNVPFVGPLLDAVLALQALPPAAAMGTRRLCADGYYMLASAAFAFAVAVAWAGHQLVGLGRGGTRDTGYRRRREAEMFGFRAQLELLRQLCARGGLTDP